MAKISKTGKKDPLAGLSVKGMQGGLTSQSRLFSMGSQAIGGMQKEGAMPANIQQTSSFFYSPELTSESWLLPKSRQEILKWCRIFYNLEPYIMSIINMHSRYPFSKFELTTPDDSVTEFYTDMAFNKDFDLFNFILQASLSYWKFGEALPFGNLEQGKDKLWRWTKFILLEPELVEISADVFSVGGPTFELIPTEELKKLVKSSNDQDAEKRKQLLEQAPEVVNAVNEGRNIQLNNENISIIANITDPSATRGTPIIQSMFKVCVAGDTKIGLLDGTNPTIEELFNKNAKDFWVYSIDSNGNIVPVRAERVAYNGMVEVVTITLDNNENIHCTKDHKLMLRDGTYKEAKDLKPGDSLMPLYRKYEKVYEKTANTSVYESVINPADGKKIPTHVLVALSCKRDEMRGKGKFVIHHDNVHKIGDSPWNSLDNTPENLFILSKPEHSRLHQKFAATPERMKELSTLAAIARNVDGKHSKKMLELWNDPKYKSKVRESMSQAAIQAVPKTIAAMTQKRNNKVERINNYALQFKETNGRYPCVSEVAKCLNVNSPVIYYLVNKVGWNALRIEKQHNKQPVLNHKVTKVEFTGKTEKVYDIVNSGPYHNFAITFNDKSGIFSSNCIYQDWIRLAQSAFAQRYVFPIELWTVGDLASNIIPTEEQLTQFRDTINQAVQQPPFTLCFPPTVKYEPLSTMGKFFPVNNEYDYIHDQMMVGLGVNKNLILGDGPSLSNLKGMALHRLIMEYKVIRDKFENWMIYKFFAPIAEKNEFYTTVRGKKKLILPQVSWYKSLDIEEQEHEKQTFIEMHKAGYLSTKTLFSKFPTLDYETEQKELESEVGTIWDKGGDRLPAKVSKTTKSDGKKPRGKGKGIESPPIAPSTGGPANIPMPIMPVEPIPPAENVGIPPTPEVPTPTAPAVPAI